jgi:hypothetical protein
MPIEQLPARTQGPAGRLMTRRQIVELLNNHGFPISLSNMNKLCMPSLAEGPEPEGGWGKNHLYDPDKVLRWARSRFRALTRPLSTARS